MSRKPSEDKFQNFARMMNEYCITNGFCGSVVDGKPMHVSQFIPQSGPVTAEQFAAWVLQAEGMDPHCGSWFKPLQLIFQQHMGKTADATELHAYCRKYYKSASSKFKANFLD